MSTAWLEVLDTQDAFHPSSPWWGAMVVPAARIIWRADTVTERNAEILDTFGQRSNYLFARHKETGQRISARKFYGLPGERGSMEREGYVLMTTAAKPRDESKQRRLL